MLQRRETEPPPLAQLTPITSIIFFLAVTIVELKAQASPPSLFQLTSSPQSLFLLGCNRTCINSSLCDCQRPVFPSSTIFIFGFPGVHSNITFFLLLRSCSAPSPTLLSFSSLQVLFAATAVTGERKAVAVLGFGGNGGAIAAALLYRGSPLPCRASKHRAPSSFIFGLYLQNSTCK